MVAVGGYGRRELSIASDIDLLFLYRGKENPYVETITETISTRLWDAKLSVGAATRTIGDALRVGREDLSTLTSYLDGRFLIGDPALFAELDRDVRAHLREHGDAFIAGKLAEQAQAPRELRRVALPAAAQREGERRRLARLPQRRCGSRRATIWEVRRTDQLRVQGFIDEEEYKRSPRRSTSCGACATSCIARGRKDDRLHFDGAGAARR